jgi:hypothetical protein
MTNTTTSSLINSPQRTFSKTFSFWETMMWIEFEENFSLRTIRSQFIIVTTFVWLITIAKVRTIIIEVM